MACADCATGVLHGGTPAGTVSTVHKLPTYVAEPPSGTQAKAIIVIIPDAFGWELPNNRILADNFAKKGGFRVLLPDFMDGHSLRHDLLETLETAMGKETPITKKIPAGLKTVTSFGPFMFYNRASVVGPRLYGFFRDLRASTDLPIGAAGYCWGGKWVTLLCSGVEKTADGQKPLIDAGYTAHPSMVDIPSEYEAVQIPLSIANGTEDMAFTKDKMEIVSKIFESPTKKDICELVPYEGAKHGFAVRGNPNDEQVVKQGTEAEDQAVRWYQKWLVKQ